MDCFYDFVLRLTESNARHEEVSVSELDALLCLVKKDLNEF